VTIIVGHECLDHIACDLVERRVGARPDVFVVAQRVSDGLLLFEGEAVTSSSRVMVEMVAHLPQEICRAGDFVGLAGDEDPDANEIARSAKPPPRPCGPEGDVEIAQSASAILHVGLEQKDRITVPPMSLVHLFFEASNEVDQLSIAEDTSVGALGECLRHRFIARNRPPIEQGRGRRQIAFGGSQRVRDGHDLMTHTDPHVPERIEERFCDGTNALGGLRREKAHIEIAFQSNHLSPVTSNRRQENRDPQASGAQGRMGCRIECGEQPVHNFCVTAGEGKSARVRARQHLEKLLAVTVDVPPHFGY
jgi:hypothetical protein